MIKVTKSKAKSVAQLTKELDEIFSLFIRYRDSDYLGNVTCFVTGKRLPILSTEPGPGTQEEFFGSLQTITEMRTPEEILKSVDPMAYRNSPHRGNVTKRYATMAMQEYADEYLKAFIKWADKSTIDSLYADPINPDNIINDFKESLKK